MDASTVALAGAARQAEALRAGQVTARDLVQAHLDRIARLDGALNAFRVVLADEALAAADAAQPELDRGGGPPLLGVAVAIKDSAGVAGQSSPTGTLANAEPVAADDEVVARLRAAGAIVIGKTTTPPLNAYPYTESLPFGATRNPWDHSRTPGGSSGGSGAAMAAGLAGVALGSDGLGSIRGPSCWNGVFGVKPTRDLVPTAPHEGGWQGMSVNGPIARTVADAALFLDAVCDTPADHHAGAAAADPGRLRVAVSTKLPRGPIARLGRDQAAAVSQTADLLRSLGHEVVHRDPDYPAELWPGANVRVLRGIADDLAALDHPELAERRVRRTAALGRALPAAAVAWARGVEAEHTRRVLALWDDVDVLLTPCCNQGPYRIGAHHGLSTTRALLSSTGRIAYLGAFNVTGQPVAALPAGVDADGLPTGVQLVGRHHAEDTLLSLSAQLERARPWAGRLEALA